MKTKIVLLFAVFLCVFSLFGIAKAQDPDPIDPTPTPIPEPVEPVDVKVWDNMIMVEESYTMPPVPRVDYVVVWRSKDLTHFRLEPVNKPLYDERKCLIYSIEVHCIDPLRNAPKVGDIVGLTDNGWFSTGDPNTQRLIYDSVNKSCWLNLATILKGFIIVPPPCCTLCKVHYEYGYQAGSAWVRTRDLGWNDFVDCDKETMPTKPIVNLSVPYEVRYTIYCDGQQKAPSGLSAILYLWWPKLSFWKDVTSRTQDGQGRIRCSDLNTVDVFLLKLLYPDYNCHCCQAIMLTDPLSQKENK